MVKTLLDHKANVHFEGLGQVTPLITAPAIGHQPIVKDMLDHGADVNKKARVVQLCYLQPLKVTRQWLKLL